MWVFMRTLLLLIIVGTCYTVNTLPAAANHTLDQLEILSERLSPVQPEEALIEVITRFLTTGNYQGRTSKEKYAGLRAEPANISEKTRIMKVIARLAQIGGSPNNKKLDGLINAELAKGIAVSESLREKTHAHFVAIAYNHLKDFTP